jgi:type IV pilus assembly protein PilE
MNTIRPHGFSLIELMVAMAIIGILASIAVPSYMNHLRRGAIEEATAELASGRVALEQYFLDNRTYLDGPCPSSTSKFTIACDDPAAPDATTYTIKATGSGSMASFAYTIDQAGLRTTTSPWGNGNCWIARKGDTC